MIKESVNSTNTNYAPYDPSFLNTIEKEIQRAGYKPHTMKPNQNEIDYSSRLINNPRDVNFVSMLYVLDHSGETQFVFHFVSANDISYGIMVDDDMIGIKVFEANNETGKIHQDDIARFLRKHVKESTMTSKKNKFNESPNFKSVSLQKFLEHFNEENNYLYKKHDSVAGYEEALDAFDDFVKRHKDFVTEFVEYRGDFLSSDREVVAFMFTLELFNLLESTNKIKEVELEAGQIVVDSLGDEWETEAGDIVSIAFDSEDLIADKNVSEKSKVKEARIDNNTKKIFIGYMEEIAENLLVDFPDADYKKLRNSIVDVVRAMGLSEQNRDHFSRVRYFPSTYKLELINNGDGNTYDSPWFQMNDNQQANLAEIALKNIGIKE